MFEDERTNERTNERERWGKSVSASSVILMYKNSFPHDAKCVVFASKKLKSFCRPLLFPSSFFFGVLFRVLLNTLNIISQERKREGKNYSLFFSRGWEVLIPHFKKLWGGGAVVVPNERSVRARFERGGELFWGIFLTERVLLRIILMSFVSRLANYVLNEFLVDALANSKTFQRFAVRADDAMRKGRVLETVAETTSKAKENAEKVAEEARATAAKMMEEAAKKTPPPPPKT